jgi:phytol kinase
MIIKDVIGAGILMAYYLGVVVLAPTLLKRWTKAPAEVVRKLQHIGYSLSIFLLLRLFSSWYVAVAAAFLLVVLAVPVLLGVEKLAWYRRNFVDRTAEGGELRKQLLYVQLSFAVLIALFWGVLGIRWQYIVAVAVVAWGFGDAAAALVGKAWGRRRVLLRFVDGCKTYEGTIAMIVVAGTALFWTLLCYAGHPWYVSLLISMLVAPVCGLVELFSRRGTDTLTVPLSTALALLPLLSLVQVLKW